MTEREQTQDEYWTADEQIGEVRLWRDEPYSLRLKARLVDEHYNQAAREEIVPLRYRRGERTYIHAKPYVLLPDIQLGVGLFPTPTATGAIGTVTTSRQTSMRHEELGECQAWFYRRDRVLILWESFLHDAYRKDSPRDDPNTTVLWEGFEQFLLRRFPTTRLIATTPDDPLYETSQYQEFLRTRGYRHLGPAAFGKPVPHGAEQDRL